MFEGEVLVGEEGFEVTLAPVSNCGVASGFWTQFPADTSRRGIVA